MRISPGGTDIDLFFYGGAICKQEVIARRRLLEPHEFIVQLHHQRKDLDVLDLLQYSLFGGFRLRKNLIE